MPRGPRLDAPGALHHVRGRGIDRGLIFIDDRDRDEFVRRLRLLVEKGALQIIAWALMPNHFHLLVRTGSQPLERSMRSLLAGYAGYFNRRHGRSGHLFQNRYKSTLCEDEPYFLTLVRYIHRNPLPFVVATAQALEIYPYTGHAVILGHIEHPWQETEEVLLRFGGTITEARESYRRFVASEDDLAFEEVPVGGGLVLSPDGWQHRDVVRRGREQSTTNERILGRQEFVERCRAELNAGTMERPQPDLRLLLRLVCTDVGVDAEGIRFGGRCRDLSLCRSGIAWLWCVHYGQNARRLAGFLGLAESSVRQAASRGGANAARWLAVIACLDQGGDGS